MLNPPNSPYRITLEVGNADDYISKQVNVAVRTISIWLEESPEIYMNDPNRRILTIATVFLRKSDGGQALTEVPIEVNWNCIHGANNTQSTNSYQVPMGNRLGKFGNAAAVYWQRHPDSAFNGTGLMCNTATAISGSNKGKAKVYFLPSGVGGDTYTLRTSIMASDGTTVIKETTSSNLTIWRSINFDSIYEMHGLNHVSRNTASNNVSSAFNPAFVRFTVGTPHSITTSKSVKYIGLWVDTHTPQDDWNTIQKKLPSEKPTATEVNYAKYNGNDPTLLAKRIIARNAIIQKAQRWVDRIDSAFSIARQKWISDAGIPNDSLLAIQYYHPKYSRAGGDWATNEWNLGGASTPTWLRVTTYSGNYTNKDPDASWARTSTGSFVGLSMGNGIITLTPGRSDPNLQQTIIHEAGHATKSFFKRDNFGSSLDHTASNLGLMYYLTNGVMNFITREKKILRGIIP